MYNDVILLAIAGLSALYLYLKHTESKQPIPLNSYDKEVNEILNKEEFKVFSETEIDLLLNNNLCEILSIKPSDLLNEKMLKKLIANV